MLILFLEMQKQLVYWRQQVKSHKETQNLHRGRTLLCGTDKYTHRPRWVFYGENKFTSWALGTRQSEEPGRRENKLIIEVSRWLSNPNRKRFITTVCATDSSSSSFELVPLPLQYLIWPQVRRLLGALRGISFLFSYLSSFRHPLSPALYLPLSDLPPSGPLDTTDAHRQSSKTDCAVKTRWKKWEFALQ